MLAPYAALAPSLGTVPPNGCKINASTATLLIKQVLITATLNPSRDLLTLPTVLAPNARAGNRAQLIVFNVVTADKRGNEPESVKLTTLPDR